MLQRSTDLVDLNTTFVRISCPPKATGTQPKNSRAEDEVLTNCTKRSMRGCLAMSGRPPPAAACLARSRRVEMCALKLASMRPRDLMAAIVPLSSGLICKAQEVLMSADCLTGCCLGNAS